MHKPAAMADMMVTSSGGRVEMRQVGTSTVYESADGGYTQLIENTDGTKTVRTTDGTQLTFAPTTDVTVLGYRCTQIKDCNGNYLSATYDGSNGHLLTATDTLGRVLTFDYPSGNLEAIKQTWDTGAHSWATFAYTSLTVAPSFSGLSINGPNNQAWTLLTQVSLHDGSYFTFGYTPFGQVHTITHYSQNGTQLSYVGYNLPGSPWAGMTAQTDCPRFTERRDKALDWNNGAEAITYYSAAGDNSWSKVTTPDGVIQKELYDITGWRSGLTNTTKVYANATDEQSDAFKKRTTILWTQDDENLSYQKNPRPTETNVYDEVGNRRRTVLGYRAITLPSGVSCSLPNDVFEYQSNATSVLRRTHTDYIEDSAYLNQRLIGLPQARYVYDGNDTIVAKSSFWYDWTSEHLAALPGGVNPVQHDLAYNTSFTVRGNLVNIARYDMNDPNNASGTVVESKWGYNVAGSVTFTRDHLWHHNYFAYADSFSDGNNGRNTFAYPTTVTDADGYQSLAKYNFDYGAIAWRQTPSPNSGQAGPTQTFLYDAAARIERITNEVNGVSQGYKRFQYQWNGIHFLSWESVNNVADDHYTALVTDGAGRLRATVSENPNSVGGYSAQYTEYDVMGGANKRSNPTEIDAGFTPQGDDATTGWVWTLQSYDWKGRPWRTTNPDGSQRENTYGGCGCAGGEVVTSRDEAGRLKKTTMDVLGRLNKVEELNWNQTVYSTTNYTFNERDQLTQISQQGQVRTMEYDGHGRLWKRTTPEQGLTEYSYYTDDTVKWVKDARGAKTSYVYNARHLPTEINYDLSAVSPAGSVVATTNATFAYDAAGNRIQMNDGYGTTNYEYDQLSRMKRETRSFSGMSYPLNYVYNLAGQLTSIKNPWNAEVGYVYDKIGRLTSVPGASYAGVSSYISNITYRAFGAPKAISYGDTKTLSLSYNNRLLLSQWNIPGVLGYSYNYDYFNEKTGRVTFASNLTNGAGGRDASLDRSYSYDHVGRLNAAYTGTAALAHTGQGSTWGGEGPYAQIYSHDVSGNRTHREGWGGIYGSYTNDSPSFTNNRQTGLTYDNAGNLTNDGSQTYAYDARGQQTNASLGNLQQGYDGDGLRVKRIENGTTYYLRSTVLGGQVVAEIVNGGWYRGYVYLGGQLLAIQDGGVYWVHQEPTTKGQRIIDINGSVTSTVEVDPFGGETARSNNSAFQTRKYTSYERDANGGDDAMMRRYGATQSRFAQPDPYDGSYNFSDPQSLNRYAYVQNDPVNFVDPSGLNAVSPDTRWGGADSFGHFGSQFHDSGYNIYYIDVVIGVETTRAYFGGSTSIYLGGTRGTDIDPGGGTRTLDSHKKFHVHPYH